jgi:hypothetical protein
MYVREIEKWILPWHKLNIELGGGRGGAGVW